VRLRHRLPPRAAGWLMPLVLSLLMTFVVSAISTLRALGPGPEFVAEWPGSWLLSWIVAFPVLLLVLPVVRRIVAWLVAPAGT
jgi:hypothetical protein